MPSSLSPAQRINRDVALAQINFLLHQHQVRRYQERALDTYTDEPFRAVDWQLQGMSQTGDKTYGTAEEWTLVSKRVAAIPAFLKVAQDQISAGIKSQQHSRLAHADSQRPRHFRSRREVFRRDATQAGGRSGRQDHNANRYWSQLRDASKQAAAAYRGLRDFVATTFFDDATKKDVSGLKPEFRADRYAMGEEEYNWAVKNNLRVNKTAAQLYEEAMPIVEATQKEMIDLARKIGEKRKLTLPAEGPAAVRAVFDELSKDYPKSDAEMVQWYNEAAIRVGRVRAQDRNL